MKNHSLYLFVALMIFNISCSDGQNAKYNLSAIEFSEKIKQMPNAPIVDVRTSEEYSNGHLINALNVDWNGNSFDQQIAKLNKTMPVFVYCLSGARSSSAAEKMREDGFKEVYEMNGGIMKWRVANLPETTNSTVLSTGMTKVQFENLLKTDQLVLVDFYADWCAPCKKMKPYLDEISSGMKDKVKVIRINADENQEICKILKIDALPVLQLYKNNSLIWTHSGYIEKEGVLKEINK